MTYLSLKCYSPLVLLWILPNGDKEETKFDDSSIVIVRAFSASTTYSTRLALAT